MMPVEEGRLLQLLWDMERRQNYGLLTLEQRLNEKLERIMTQQSQTQIDVDNATTAINTLTGAVNTSSAQLETAVAALKTALGNLPPNTDTTALDTAVAQVATAQQTLGQAASDVSGLVPQPPATPPAPAS